MQKYRVRTRCKQCGAVYHSKAKKTREPPTKCKVCNSRKTESLWSHPV